MDSNIALTYYYDAYTISIIHNGQRLLYLSKNYKYFFLTLIAEICKIKGFFLHFITLSKVRYKGEGPEKLLTLLIIYNIFF